MSLTSVMVEAKDVKNIMQDPQTIVKKGAIAPIDGVIVPYDLFRTYQINEFENKMNIDNLIECQQELNKKDSPDNYYGPLWFAGGVVVGLLSLRALR